MYVFERGRLQGKVCWMGEVLLGVEKKLTSRLHVTGGGRHGLKGFSRVRVAETVGQASTQKATQLAGRLTGASRGADEGTRCLFLSGSPIPQ